MQSFLKPKSLNTPRRRSMSFCIGNKQAETMLRRMLDSNALPHTLLLHGPRGVGKAKCALSLAEALLGSSPKLMTGNHPDLHQLHPEGKAHCHPIENVRALIKEASLPPFEAPAKVF